MLIIDRRKKWLIELEIVHFIEDYTQYKTDADVVYFEQSKNSPRNTKLLYTLHIDLSKSEEELFSNFSSSTRRDIRKAEKLDLKWFLNIEPTYQDICEFYDHYYNFCLIKKLNPILINQIMKYWDMGALAFAGVTDWEKGKLNRTCYILDKDKQYVRRWLNGSNFRNNPDPKIKNLIGLANRYTDWQCIREFKRLGFLFYDFGGLTLQKDNIKMSNIDNFKMGFGGNIVSEYNFRYGKTAVGKLALFFYNIFQKVKR